ncbi:MAG: S-layer homology domain-containing protein [Clostridiales bacterium]|nr:S-layer homology domain-containing protein [Clostridiales bacterium]
MSKKRKFNRILAVALAALMFLAVSPLAAFADNSAGHWGESYIREAQAYRWVPTNLGASYNVDTPITRGELALVVWQAFGMPEPAGATPYTDVPENLVYSDAFTYLYEQNIILGSGNGIAGPTNFSTREMIFTVVARLFALTPEDADAYDKYIDADEVNDWAIDAISALSELDIVEGDPEGYVHPQDSITFAELIKVLVATNRRFEGDAGNPLIRNPNTPYSPAAAANSESVDTGKTPSDGGTTTDTTKPATTPPPRQALPVGPAGAPVSSSSGSSTAPTVERLSPDKRLLNVGDELLITVNGTSLSDAVKVLIFIGGTDNRASDQITLLDATDQVRTYSVKFANAGVYRIAAIVGSNVEKTENVTVADPNSFVDSGEYSITVSHLADLTFVVIASDTNYSSVTVNTVAAVSQGQFGSKYEWRAVLDGIVPLSAITVATLP